MLQIRDTIKFMLANIMFTLREFRLYYLNEINPPHFHGKDTIEIHFIKSGTGKFIINKKEYPIKPNSFFIIPEFIEHAQIPDEGVTIEKYSIYLLYDDKRGFVKYIPYLRRFMTGVDTNNIFSSFDKAFYELNNKNFGYNEIVVSCFKEIFVILLRDLGFNNERITKWNPDTLEFEIEEIFIKEFNTITIENLSSRCFMSVRDMQRFLEKAYRSSFSDLKTFYRMSYAANRLTYSNDSVAKIAIDCGYSTSEHFSYAFKKYYNKTPSEYRKKVVN